MEGTSTLPDPTRLAVTQEKDNETYDIKKELPKRRGEIQIE